MSNMKDVLELVEAKKQVFTKLPFFEFLADTSIDPRKKLVWAPYAAPFLMNIKDLNSYALGENLPQDSIQEKINNHTVEDGRHWMWFLPDLQKLGLDCSLKFTDALRFLWGDETERIRQLSYDLALCTFQKDPILKVAVIEAIEATANVAFPAFAEVTDELQKITQHRYLYFGQTHNSFETGHIHGVDEAEEYLSNLPISDEQKSQAIELVDRVFAVFTELTNLFLELANQSKEERPFVKSVTMELCEV